MEQNRVQELTPTYILIDICLYKCIQVTQCGEDTFSTNSSGKTCCKGMWLQHRGIGGRRVSKRGAEQCPWLQNIRKRLEKASSIQQWGACHVFGKRRLRNAVGPEHIFKELRKDWVGRKMRQRLWTIHRRSYSKWRRCSRDIQDGFVSSS